jgi:hypothetical protein
MLASDAARALSNRRWAKEDARHKTRGKWTGERNPNYAVSAEQQRAIVKRLNEARWRKQASKQALQLQEHMDQLRMVADALWGDRRPKPPKVQGPHEWMFKRAKMV